jgi:hypothetical protein
MRINRIAFPLSVCLLGILAVWLLGHRSSNPQVAIPSSQTVLDSIPVAEAVAHPISARESSSAVRVEPPQPKSEIRQAIADLTLTNSESPINSQDLDQNREWARNFPAEALAWLKNAPDGKQRLAISEIVCSQLAQTNVVVAVKLAENCLGEGTNDTAQFLLDNMAQQWASQDMQAASAWALAKPAGEQRDRLLQRIAIAEAAANPADAAQLISQQMSPGPTQNEAAISVLYQWAQTDAAAALTWAESFPAGDLRDRAIKEVKNVSAYAAAAAAGNPPTN